MEEGCWMTRPKRYLMKLPEREIQFGDRTLVMGILNITPDSFSDGDKYMDPDRAVERALELEELGADIIDIGGESTRPGAERIEAAEELRRIIPVLKKLKGKLSIPISVDTYKAEVAARAIERGAEIVNDPSGLTLDLNMPKVVGDANAGLILNHMRGTPETWSKLGPIVRPMRAVIDDLAAAISRARNGGIDKTRIIADPGLGFGKRGEQNYELLARLGEMVELDVPIMAGPSRKSFLGQSEMIEKDRATAAAVTVAVLHGAHIVRVHDIAGIRAVLQTVDSIVRSLSEEQVEPKQKKAAPAPTLRQIAAGAEAPKPVRPPRVFHAEDQERPAAGDRPPYRREREERPYERDDHPPYRGGDRPFRKDGPPRGDRPFRKDGPPRGDRPPFRGDGPPRGDRPPYRSGGDRPFRKDGPPRGDRPPFRGDGPPRGDKPPYRAGGDRPFRKDGPPRGDRPPFRGDGPPRGDRPFRKDGPPRGDRPFRKDGPPRGGGKPGFKGKGGGGFKPPRPRRDD
jgi:dihydropteroate synthase